MLRVDGANDPDLARRMTLSLAVQYQCSLGLKIGCTSSSLRSYDLLWLRSLMIKFLLVDIDDAGHMMIMAGLKAQPAARH